MFIMLLNDGETFTNLDGCAIIEMPDDFDSEDIENDLVAMATKDETPRGRIVTVFQDQA